MLSPKSKFVHIYQRYVDIFRSPFHCIHAHSKRFLLFYTSGLTFFSTFFLSCFYYYRYSELNRYVYLLCAHRTPAIHHIHTYRPKKSFFLCARKRLVAQVKKTILVFTMEMYEKHRAKVEKERKSYFLWKIIIEGGKEWWTKLGQKKKIVFLLLFTFHFKETS